MFDFVPIRDYYSFYINLCLFFIIFTLLHTAVIDIDIKKNLNFINFSGFLLLVFSILYLGQRPIHYSFGDTLNYSVGFNNYANGAPIGKVKDFGWHLFMKTLSGFVSIHTFFTICAFIYIYPLYKISKNLFKDYWYYAFVMFIVSFSFFTYGTNGVRNGMACSMFLWGISYRHNKIIMLVLFFLATTVHQTLLLPIMAFAITYYYNNPKVYLKGWLACIPLSLIMGSVWIALFTNLGFGGDRLAGYLSGESSAGASSGFRWDFLFHSMFAVFAGWYFIYKKQFKDLLYFQLLNTYLICNGFWILVIRANFSNRFAYLSWFMMAIIIIYPFLKQQFFKNQHLVIGKVLVAYFAFTYIMYYVYYADKH